MSGHSHYATIKRQKGLQDAARGRIFSKLTRGIHIAVKSGGGSDPASNYKLRMAIELARVANMPKENIDRAINAAAKANENLEEVTYEGFGPGGIGVIVEAATNNRNRTGQELKNMMEKVGGSMAGPGAVAFNFDPKGLILVAKDTNPEDQMLKLIDLRVEDIQETDDAIEVYVAPENLSSVREKLTGSGFEVRSAELVKKAKNFNLIEEAAAAKKVLDFLDNLEDHDDVQKVYTNVDIPEQVLSQI